MAHAGQGRGDGERRPEPLDALIHDWNGQGAELPRNARPPALRDETLLLAPPRVSAASRVGHLRRIDAMGFAAAGVASGPDLETALEVAAALALERAGPRLAWVGPGRPPTIDAAARLADASRRAVEVDLALAGPRRGLGSLVRRARALGLDVGIIVPSAARGVELGRETEALLDLAVQAGALRVVLADQLGATPEQARGWVARAERRLGGPAGGGPIVAWRGRDTRGLGVAASLAAARSGAARLHGALLGPAEAVPIDQVALNLDLEGEFTGDVTQLVEACERAAQLLGRVVPPNYPLVGCDAFRTATGVHAAAIVKAFAKGDRRLADLVYSGVPAARYGKHQVIEVGPMSGMSNVRFWLERHGVPFEPALAAALLARAKTSSAILTEEELHEIVARHRRGDHDP